jgi:lipoprotein-anchoring transpeptidase ErfK/SrfK
MRTLSILFGLLLATNSYADIYYSESLNSSSSQDYNYETDSSSLAPAKYTIYSSNESYSPKHKTKKVKYSNYSSDMPTHISTQEKVIIVNPNIHAWAAYSASGKLLRSGRASAGSKWCHDIGRPCRTKAGTFRIYSLGSSDCYSRKYPIGEGGAPMPYCMYFNGGQGLHGSNDIYGGNKSHGCIRISVGDARWLRYNFAGVGTKVIVRPY